MPTEIERAVQAASARAVPGQLMLTPASTFWSLLVDLHRRATSAGGELAHGAVSRLSPEDAREAFATARNRWLALLAVAPDRHGKRLFSALLTEVESRGSLEGFQSLFLSGWSRSAADERLGGRAARAWERLSGSVTTDGGLPHIPVLDSDGGGLRFLDARALQRLAGLGDAATLQDLLRNHGSPGGPAEAVSLGEVVRWGAAIAGAAVGGYIGFKTGNPVAPLATGFGVVSGFYLGMDSVGTHLGNAADAAAQALEDFFTWLITVEDQGCFPIDAGLPETGSGGSGSQGGTSGGSGDDGGASDGAGDDGGDDGGGSGDGAGDDGGGNGDPGGGGDAGFRPDDGGGANDGGVSVRDRLRQPGGTFDLAQWRSLAGFGAPGVGGRPGSPGGLGLGGLLTPNPDSGADGNPTRRIAGTVNVDTERGVRMPGPGGIKMVSGAFAATADVSAMITVAPTGVRWRPSAGHR